MILKVEAHKKSNASKLGRKEDNSKPAQTIPDIECGKFQVGK